MKRLLQHVQKMTSAKERQHYACLNEQQQPGKSKPSVTAKAVNMEARAKLAKLLFGPDGENNATPGMKRLLDSWADLGYPSEGKPDKAECNRCLESLDVWMTDGT